MIKSILLSVLLSGSLILYGQTLSITFSATGASDKVDSVKAMNLRTNQNVILPGNDTLILNYFAGIPVLSNNGYGCSVFPNPFPGKATFVAGVPVPQTVLVKVYSLAGQLIAQTRAAIQPGSCMFDLSVSKPGIYLISLTGNKFTTSCKAICAETSESSNHVFYSGNDQKTDHVPSLKEALIYSLDYTDGDIILYRCRGGIHTTIITDSPKISKKYVVEFAPCIDPAGKSYSIVKIGSQTWMAENLAYLPMVSKPDTGSDSLKFYYVYGYDDTIVNAAKNTVNYKTYGVLYNWPAAMNTVGRSKAKKGSGLSVCPAGWHMPQDGEWKILEMALGMNQSDADTVNWRTSGSAGEKMKATVTWLNDSVGSNFSGFTALPGGYRNTHGDFRSIGEFTIFWSSTLSDTAAWYRSLRLNNEGTYRLSTLQSHGMSVRCIKDGL